MTGQPRGFTSGLPVAQAGRIVGQTNELLELRRFSLACMPCPKKVDLRWLSRSLYEVIGEL